jgi:hypothetical protein
MPQQINDYLRTYPVHWPIFSTKYYKKNEDGWWCPQPRKKREKKTLIYLNQNKDTNNINQNQDTNNIN